MNIGENLLDLEKSLLLIDFLVRGIVMKSSKFLFFILVLVIVLSTFSIPALASENYYESDEDSFFADNFNSTAKNQETEVDKEAIVAPDLIRVG